MYQSTPSDIRRAYTIGIIYAILAIGLGVMLFKIWPPIPWPTPEHKERGILAAYLAETGCPLPSTATPTPAAATAATNTSPTPNTAGGTQTTTVGTQPAAGGQPGTPTNGTNAGSTQPSGAAPGNTQSTTTGTTQTIPQTGGASGSSNEIILIPISVFGRCMQTTFDERLLMLVIVAGILGAFVHGATSLADYIGNNSFNKSWTWFYLLRPAIGMSLALVFYFVIRGGFLSTTGGAQDINPYGIAALAGLVGMFSKQATDKLSEVFGTLFRSAPGRGDAKRQHPLTPTTSATIQVEPASVVAGGESFKLTVSGTGFVDGATIRVDDVAQATTFESANKVSAQIPAEKIANPATLRIAVVNPDETRFGPVDLVVSAGDDNQGEGDQGGDGEEQLDSQ